MAEQRDEAPLTRFLRFSSATDAISKNIQRFKNGKLSQFGLKSMHLMFLCCLERERGGMTPGELSSACGVDKAFISRIARELCEMGYVSYSDGDSGSEENERRGLIVRGVLHAKYKKRLMLTERGLEVMSKVGEILDEAVSKVTSGISDEKIDALYEVLGLINSRLAEDI